MILLQSYSVPKRGLLYIDKEMIKKGIGASSYRINKKDCRNSSPL